MQMKTSRVETLCDGIFAIAMTLLVISLNEVFKWPKAASERELFRLVGELWPDVLYYFQSFIILGAFWLAHHKQFHYIQRTDTTLIFINIMALMFVALIPLTTVLVGDYRNNRVSAIIFEADFLLAGAAFYLHWRYATRGHRLVDPGLSAKTIRLYSARSLAIPAVSAVGICLSLINPALGTALYLVIPFIMIFQKG